MDSSEENEDILQRHRKERKDLQGKITALKKSIPKNDKKKKKEVSEIIEKLEKELEERQKQELAEQPQNGGDIRGDVDDVVNVENGDASEEVVQEKRVSKAQRRRNKKEAEDKERDKRIEEQEKINKKGPRVQELNSIVEALKKDNLQIYDIPADGNCMYCAVQHQLEITDRETYNVDQLRLMTATFIRENKDDFIPFMCNDDEELLNDEQFEKYCQNVAKTKVWGGQLELRALSNVLSSPIKVIQSTGPTTIQGEQFKGTPMTLTYHRHLYRLGEHYNSTSALQKEEDN